MLNVDRRTIAAASATVEEPALLLPIPVNLLPINQEYTAPIALAESVAGYVTVTLDLTYIEAALVNNLLIIVRSGPGADAGRLPAHHALPAVPDQLPGEHAGVFTEQYSPGQYRDLPGAQGQQRAEYLLSGNTTPLPNFWPRIPSCPTSVAVCPATKTSSYRLCPGSRTSPCCVSSCRISSIWHLPRPKT